MQIKTGDVLLILNQIYLFCEQHHISDQPIAMKPLKPLRLTHWYIELRPLYIYKISLIMNVIFVITHEDPHQTDVTITLLFSGYILLLLFMMTLL